MCAFNYIYVSTEAFCARPQIMKPGWINLTRTSHTDFESMSEQTDGVLLPTAVSSNENSPVFTVSVPSLSGAARRLTDRECESGGASSRWMVWGLWTQ